MPASMPGQTSPSASSPTDRIQWSATFRIMAPLPLGLPTDDVYIRLGAHWRATELRR